MMVTMLLRVAALVLALTTMSLPLALAVCRVECADAATNRDQAAHHSCHGAGETAAVSMTAVPHMCGHTDDAPAGLERAWQIVVAPVAVMPLAAWTPPPAAVERIVPVDIPHSPPGSFQLVSQLRV
jgi:hypothetical protein